MRKLKMVDVHAIRVLNRAGYSKREIARLTGARRETVANYVAADDSKPAKPDHRIRPELNHLMREKAREP